MCFPGGSGGKEPTSRCRRHKRLEFDPWIGKIPRTRACNPLQYSVFSIAKSQMWLKWLSMHASSEVFILFAHSCPLKVVPCDFHFDIMKSRLCYRTAEWPWASHCTYLGSTYFTKGGKDTFWMPLLLPNFRVIYLGKSWNKSCFIFHKYSEYLFCYSDTMRHITADVEIEQF